MNLHTLFKLLLRLYPKEFQRRFGPEMLESFELEKTKHTSNNWAVAFFTDAFFAAFKAQLDYFYAPHFLLRMGALSSFSIAVFCFTVEAFVRNKPYHEAHTWLLDAVMRILVYVFLFALIEVVKGTSQSVFWKFARALLGCTMFADLYLMFGFMYPYAVGWMHQSAPAPNETWTGNTPSWFNALTAYTDLAELLVQFNTAAIALTILGCLLFPNLRTKTFLPSLLKKSLPVYCSVMLWLTASIALPTLARFISLPQQTSSLLHITAAMSEGLLALVFTWIFWEASNNIQTQHKLHN